MAKINIVGSGVSISSVWLISISHQMAQSVVSVPDNKPSPNRKRDWHKQERQRSKMARR